MAWDAVDLSYAAGIVDGEGCIHIGNTYSRAVQAKKNKSHVLTVRVVTTDNVITPWFLQKFGGTFYTYQRREISKKTGKLNKSYKIWQMKSDKAGEFLQLILPYLKLKQRRAEVALEFLKCKFETRGRVGTFNPIPLEVVEKREQFAAEVRAANQGR